MPDYVASSNRMHVQDYIFTCILTAVNVVVRTGTVTPSSATIIFNAVPGENVQQYTLEVNDQQGNPVQNVPVNPNQATNGQFNIPVNNLQPGTGYIVFVQGAIGGQTFQLGSTTVNTPCE